MRIIIAILVIGAIGLVALDRPEKSITCLIVLLIYYVRYIWIVNIRKVLFRCLHSKDRKIQ
nr:hypothetical protein [Prevotella sp.]